MKLRMKNLEECFKAAEREGATWVGVIVKAKNCESSELIINPNVNFATKLEYYKNAYNDDLTLKACKDIKILGFTFADSLKEMEEDLFPEEDYEVVNDKASEELVENLLRK